MKAARTHNIKLKAYRQLFLLLIIFLSISAIARQPLSREQYINKYKEVAIHEMAMNGIPASITLAQGILESANGNGVLAVNANNHFGIKCHVGWDGPGYTHDDDEIGECFRVYESEYQSYADHSAFLTSRRWYAPLFELDVTDYRNWAIGLKKAGYATDPAYAVKLIKIIEDNKLHFYDWNFIPNIQVALQVPKKEIPINVFDDLRIAAIDYAQENENGSYVKLIGKIKEHKFQNMSKATIYVFYKDGKLYDTYTSSDKGRSEINLPLNEVFILVFSKEGFVAKKVAIDTHVPSSEKSSYKFNYTMYLFESIHALDVPLLNDPVAYVTCNEFYNRFDYDHVQTNMINKEIDRMYRNYYLLASR